MVLVRKDGMIYAPVPDWLDNPDTLLCEHSEHGEAVVPSGPGDDLDMCLYSLRNSNDEAGRLQDGTTVELDGLALGHFESFHFIPVKKVSEEQ